MIKSWIEIPPGLVSPPIDAGKFIVDLFAAAANRAILKDHERDLTDEERFAICFFAGVPIESVPAETYPWISEGISQLNYTMKLRTKKKCGLCKMNGKWHVMTEA